jgi:hypothetical protein
MTKQHQLAIKIAYNLLQEKTCNKCLYIQEVGFKKKWCSFSGKFKWGNHTCTQWKHNGK